MQPGEVMTYRSKVRLEVRRSYRWLQIPERERIDVLFSTEIRCVWQPQYRVDRAAKYRTERPSSVDDARKRHKPLFLWMNYLRWRVIRYVREIEQANRAVFVPVTLLRQTLQVDGHANEIKDRLVEANTALAFRIAGRCNSPAVDRDDAEGEALNALTRAVDRFDAANGTAFSSYAFTSIIRSLYRQQSVAEKRRSHEVCQLEPMAEPARPASEQPDGLIDLKHLLQTNAARLTAQEARVLTERYGLNGRPEQTLRAVAASMKLSREQIMRLQNSAVQKLRQVFNV